MQAAAKDSKPKNKSGGASSVSVPFFAPVVQPKLSVNQPGDVYEQEADAMADKVMRMAAPQQEGAFFKPATPFVQRKCQHCEEEEKKLHRKESGSETPVVDTHTENYVQSLNGKGRTLAPGEKDFFEPRFGHDFSSVRLHTDTVAAKSAQSINALAYTTGNNIVFNQGQFSPGTDGGKKLLAHELTHVVQQTGMAGNKPVQRIPDGNQSNNNNKQQQSGPVCPGFAPIASVTKKIGATTTVLGLTDDKFDVFNNGPGNIDASVCGTSQAANTQGKLTFTAGNTGAAWQTSAKVTDCTDPAPTGNGPTPWRIGFIQTVESANYGANYGNSHFIAITSSGRDALNKTGPNNAKIPVPAPWFDLADAAFGSQLYPTLPMINDTPFATFPITHPADPKSFLQSVCMKGKFNIWLIIHHKDVAPTEANVDYLYNWSINVNLNFFLNNTQGALHPCNITGWMKTGMLTLSKGPGKGGNKLIWDQPIANDAKKTDSSVTTDPCSAPAATNANDKK